MSTNMYFLEKVFMLFLHVIGGTMVNLLTTAISIYCNINNLSRLRKTNTNLRNLRVEKYVVHYSDLSLDLM